LSLTTLYKSLSAFRKSNPVLNTPFTGEFEFLQSNDESKVFAIQYHLENNYVFAIFNLSDVLVNAEIKGIQKGEYSKFPDDSKILIESDSTFDLEPFGYQIFSKSK